MSSHGSFLMMIATHGIMEIESMTRQNFSLILFLVCAVFLPQTVFAQELERVVSTTFDSETIRKGFTLESEDQLMRLGIRPAVLNEATRIDIKTLDSSLMAETLPPDRTLIGNIYLFDILNKTSYDGKDFFFLEIKYPEDEQIEGRLHDRRRFHYYNKVKSQWEELPSEDNLITRSVRARIHLPYARLAIFEEGSPEVGAASWYGYKNCDCAASPDYPKGTMLVVTRVDDPTKSVTVKVNDYGPDRAIHPDRVIDLDKVAFKKLASLRAGLIDVRVRLLH